jgi:hypothetical protein
MSAAEVLDIQATMLDRLTTSGSKFSELIARQSTYRQDGTRTTLEDGFAATNDVTVLLSMAEAYHVSKDMTPLIRWAASQLDETDHFTREMAPSEYGFVRFEEPLVMHDARGKIMKANLLLWGPRPIEDALGKRNVVIFYYFNDLNDPDDYTEELFEDTPRHELVTMFNRYMLSGFEHADEHMRLGPAMVMPSEKVLRWLTDDGATPSEYTNMLRQFYAFWLLTQQTIARREDADVPRPFARRAKRMGLPPRVSVIHLRHESAPGEGLGETDVRWSHRWLVRSTWQWRACGQDHPYAQPYEKGWHCRTWVAAHVKGPKGLPLVQSTKVYSLDR